jgi:hypothetical protein
MIRTMQLVAQLLRHSRAPADPRGARRLKRPAPKIVGKPASRVSACFEHSGPATAVFNEKRSPSRQSSP